MTRAERTDGGYTFTGTATYLSGSAHADWILAGALVTEGGEPVVTDAGIEIRVGVIPIDQARSLDTWHVTGMRATGSTDYAFENVAVAADWTFEPFRVVPTGDDVLSAIPIWAQLGGTLAACAVGAAREHDRPVRRARRGQGPRRDVHRPGRTPFRAGRTRRSRGSRPSRGGCVAPVRGRGLGPRRGPGPLRQRDAGPEPVPARDRGSARRAVDRSAPRRRGDERDQAGQRSRSLPGATSTP